MTSLPKTAGRAVEEWTAHGQRCLIMSGPFNLNGYVQLPAFLRSNGLTAPVRVHGGLSYGPDAHGWVGFHTLHGGDYWPIDDIIEYLGPVHRTMAAEQQANGTNRWNLARLRAEVERLAEQIAQQVPRAALDDGT